MITKKFGQRIKELRSATGLSQEKFALQIEMDRTYYASVESGKRNISIINIKKIADGLGVTLSELFVGLWFFSWVTLGGVILNRKEITCNFSNEGTRNEVRMRVVSKFAEEPPGTGRDNLASAFTYLIFIRNITNITIQV